jgi:RNA polymerase sigma factor (sigma-70 family)
MTSRLIQQVRRGALLGLTDGQLLAYFIERRDEAAFEALVRRHGLMVLGVCRRVLRDLHDAEDAFQATFLVLARKAASLRSRELVGNWLYGTAYRTAQEARATIARRRARERQVEDMPDPRAEPEPAWRELLPLLDQELSRLPDRYRVPVVLCELEGKTRKDVARLLGLPEGTLSWRLARARKLLARRLARYGLTLSGGALAVVLAEGATAACVTSALATSTAKAAALASGGDVLAAGVVPARVIALTEGVMKTMLLSKLKTVVAVAFVVVVSVGAVGLTYGPGVAQAPPAPKAERPLADELEELRLEVAALRKGLEVTRERVKVLEAEAQTRKGAANQPRDASPELRLNVPPASIDLVNPNVHLSTGHELRFNLQPAQPHFVLRFADTRTVGSDPLAEAEAALQKLRKDPNDKQATDALEKALKRLKERAKPKVDPASRQQQ